MAANASSSEVECTCPVCCDIFTDPVLLLCGHSFCKSCLQDWWRRSTQQTCPICKEVFPMGEPPRNLALRNLSDALRQERSQRVDSASEEICSLHSEKLKLFCHDDRQLICLVCRDSHKHKKHNCVPVNEAAESQRTQLKVQLMTLKGKLESFNKVKFNCDKMESHIKLQAQQTEKAIKEEFKRLYRFLRAEETFRIDAVRKEATLKTEAMRIRIVNLTAQMSLVTHCIKTIENQMRADDDSFMLNIKSIMERSQCNLQEPEAPLGALIDEAKHLGNLLFTVWMNSKIKYSPVTLDPNTVDPLLTISEQATRSTRRDKSQLLPANPERLGSSDVLGSEGFRSGKHSWDVEVGGYWALGVAARTNNQTSKPWGIYICNCHVWLHELRPKDGKCGGDVISKDLFPQKVRVQLDYDRGKLTFFDLDRKRIVHTMKHTFTEAVFPYFRDNAKILPAVLSVKIAQST